MFKCLNRIGGATRMGLFERSSECAVAAGRGAVKRPFPLRLLHCQTIVVLFQQQRVKSNDMQELQEDYDVGKQRRLEVDYWAEGRAKWFAMLVHQLALGAEPAYEACRMARKRVGLDGGPILPPGDEWESLSQNPQKMMEDVWESLAWDGLECPAGEFLGQLHGASQSVQNSDWDEVISELRSMTVRVFLEELRWYGEEEAEAYKAHILQVERDLRGEGQIPADAMKRLKSPSVIFFFGLWMPCLVEYGIAFHELLQRARERDLEAFKMLLRLGPVVLEDKRLRQWYYEIESSGNDTLWLKIKACQGGGALRAGVTQQRGTSLYRVKVTLAAFLVRMSRELQASSELLVSQFPQGLLQVRRFKITQGQVLKLFDAVAEDMGRGKRDISFPADKKSFFQSLRREIRQQERIWTFPEKPTDLAA
jgi:hypothetical protein